MTGPLIGIEEFRKLALRVGTLREIEPLLGDLGAAVVDLDGPTGALVPWASLPSEATGQRVVVATGLHPLRVAGRSFSAALITREGALVTVASEIPDGSLLS